MIHLITFTLMAFIALIGGAATYRQCKKDKTEYPAMAGVVAAVLAMMGMTLLAGVLAGMWFILQLIIPV